MSITQSVTDHFNLNIYTAQVGATPSSLYNKILTLLNQYCPRMVFPESLPRDFTEQSKQKLPFKDWFKGFITCQYLPTLPIIEFQECQVYYKCHAALLIVDMSKNDSQKYTQEMLKLKRTIHNDQITCSSIIIFNADKEHLALFEDEKDYAGVPDGISDDKLCDFLYKRIQQLVMRVAATFLKTIDRLLSETHIVPLFNAKEEVPKDYNKVKKKKQARSLKLCGDFALMLGCWKDAASYYSRAQKQLESTEDYVWLGKVKEAQLACLYRQVLFGEEEQGVVRDLGREAKEKLEAASQLYKKVRTPPAHEFDFELFWKRLSAYKDFRAYHEFQELVRQYQENIKYGLKGEDIYKTMSLIAGFYYDLEMYRKSGLYLKLLGDQIVLDAYDFDLARDIYLSCFPLYGIVLHDYQMPESFPRNALLNVVHRNRFLPKKIIKTSPRLQLQLLKDVMHLSSRDKPFQARMLAIILHYFMDDIEAQMQEKLFNQLMEIGNSLRNNLRLDLSLLPKVLKVVPIPETVRINVRYASQDGGDSGGLFIYNPWKALGKDIDYNWMDGEYCCVKVYLMNMFSFEIFVESITLVIDGLQTISYPASLNMLSKQKQQEVLLKFKPLTSGTLSILGVMIKVSNFCHFHPINPKGSVIDPESNSQEATYGLGIKNIVIKERINTLKMYFDDKDEVLQLSKKSPFYVRIMVKNKNDCTIIIKKIVFVFVLTDSSIIETETEPSEKIIKPYEQSSIVFYRSVLTQEEVNITELFKSEMHIMHSENVSDIANIDSLNRVYVKVHYCEKGKPDADIEDSISKSVNMKKGLLITRMHVYNSLVMNSLKNAGNKYRHVNLDDYFYLVIEVVRFDLKNDTNEYKISFHWAGKKEVLGQETLSSEYNDVRVVVKVHRDIIEDLEPNEQKLKEILYGKWKERNQLGSGYLFLEDINVSPLLGKMKKRKFEVEIQTNLENEGENSRGKVGVYYRITAVIKQNEKSKKNYLGTLVISDDFDLERGSLFKDKKHVIVKGKKTRMLELQEEKNEAAMTLDVVFMEERMFKIFFFAVDETERVVYSYSDHKYITITV